MLPNVNPAIIAAIVATCTALLVTLFNRLFFISSDNQKSISEHDKLFFYEGNKILSEERFLNILNDQLWGNHSIRVEDYESLLKWRDYLADPKKQYLDRKIIKETKQFLMCLHYLIRFIEANFMMIKFQSPNNTRIYLQPDLNLDRSLSVTKEQSALYDDYTQELNNLIDKLEKQYNTYRLVIRAELKI